MSKTKSPTCVGAGLVALDIVTAKAKGDLQLKADAFCSVGGSCGNVLLILAHIGWGVTPVARLGDDKASAVIRSTFAQAGANLTQLTTAKDDPAPTLMHYIKHDGLGGHRFDFYNPRTGRLFPRYKPVTISAIDGLVSDGGTPSVFYCDRIAPSHLHLAKHFYDKGALVFLEPQSAKPNDLARILPYVHVLKISRNRIAQLDGVRSARTAPLVIIETLGNEGLRYRIVGKSRILSDWQVIPSIPGIRAVDCAGAGDWTTASILHNGRDVILSANLKDIATVLRKSRLWGALATMFPGARGLMRHMNGEALLALQDLDGEAIPGQDRIRSAAPDQQTSKLSSLLTRLGQ